MITKKKFCCILQNIINTDIAREEFFDKLDGIINFEPFYEVSFLGEALQALAENFGPDGAIIIDWYYETNHGEKDFGFEEDGEYYELITPEDIYDYLVKDKES